MEEKRGYVFEQDKFSCGNFHKEKAVTINSLRIKECPVQIEAQVCGISPLTGSQGNLVSVDATITCVHISEALLIHTQRGVKFNVEKWNPSIIYFATISRWVTDSVTTSDTMSNPVFLTAERFKLFVIFFLYAP
jgi:flavin reductase (DIM6/NTAB) family NADH-FMN oxidoreductase RutF